MSKIKLELSSDALSYITTCVSSDLEKSTSISHIEEKIDVYKTLKAAKKKHAPKNSYFLKEDE